MPMSQPISRRTLLDGALLALGIATAGAASALADEEIKEADKIRQAEAHYQSHPNGQQRCQICLQFLPPGKCRIVHGPITRSGWCQFFAARENAH
jgi:hypothetical protein